MEISGVSTSLNANSFASSSTVRTDSQRLERSDEAREVRHEHGHHAKGRRGLAMGVFKQELRMALKAHFHMKFAVVHQGYDRLQETASSDDVAEEALGAAKQLVAEEPVQAAKSLISFRAKVHESASYVRETVSAQDDIGEVDDAVARVDQGLVKLQDDVAANRESSASVLAIDTRSKQRSTISIRTQDGDVVKLSLKRVDSLSAADVAVSNGDTFASSTEIEVSSRSRMMLHVEGDLNESEMAAIQNVFAQAEQIANEFFGGDIGAAFNIAEGFEFDTEQLARVNMRFKMRQVSNVSYAESVRPAALAPAGSPAVAVAEQVAAPTAPPAIVPAEIETVAQPVATEQAKITPPDTSALSSFFDSLSAFLRSVGDGFAAGSTSGSFSYHYSESFKLDLLKAVIHTVAPEDSTDSAANAVSLINEISS